MKITRRDHTVAEYNVSKIENALSLAFKNSKTSCDNFDDLIENIKSEINKIARVSIGISTADEVLIQKENLPSSYVAIAIGGEWSHRTYNNWSELIDKLIKKNSKVNLVFVGSKNAKESAQVLTKSFPQNNIFNCVRSH